VRVALAWIAVASAGCSSLLGIDDLRLADDARPTDAPDDAAGANCIGGGLMRVCPDPPPTSQLVVERPLEINTADPTTCVTMMSGTTEVCVIVHASIEITPAGALRAIGPRPLVLAAMSSISILGTLDASSVLGKPPGAGADPASCLAIGIPAGSDGGAGGSFGGAGGAGGNGGTAAPPPVAVTEIRGGCAGGRGGSMNQTLGAGGGAVYLMARDRIVIDGRLNASGAGGDRGNGTISGGGAGGGAGGLIGLDAPEITGRGMIFANGGGGGGAGSSIAPGSPGQESPEAKIPGVGGSGNGPGGDGSFGDQIDGVRGGDGMIGGGGGGGGAGAIYTRGNLTVTGAISPAAAPSNP
jgi:hypothetical protein